MNKKFPFKIKKQFRLKGWDYSQSGYYFITICVQYRINLFINVGTDLCVRSINKNNLNNIGLMIQKSWLKIPSKFSNIKLDEFCIMPNHIHGIIIINNAQTHGSTPTLGTIIQWFKTMTTNEYIKNIKTNNWPKFNKKIWQPRFHDRIIRNEKEYFAIKKYIQDNIKNWGKDKENV